MTTLALPILVLLVIVLLLLAAGLILRQKYFGKQAETMEEIKQRLCEMDSVLQDIQAQQLQKSRQEEEQKTCIEETVSPKNSAEPENSRSAEKTEPQAQIKTEQLQTVSEAVPLQETLSAESDSQKSEGHSEPGSKTPEATIYNIGKSGKVYTKEELELLIKE